MVWVKLDKLDKGGGSAFTIQISKEEDEFNGIVFAERKELVWMIGSTTSKRWSPTSDQGVYEKDAGKKFVFISATFKTIGNKQRIRIFR